MVILSAVLANYIGLTIAAALWGPYRWYDILAIGVVYVIITALLHTFFGMEIR